MKKLSIISIVIAIICVLTSVVLGVIGEEDYVVYSLSIGGIGTWVFLFSKFIIWRQQSYLR